MVIVRDLRNLVNLVDDSGNKIISGDFIYTQGVLLAYYEYTGADLISRYFSGFIKPKLLDEPIIKTRGWLGDKTEDIGSAYKLSEGLGIEAEVIGQILWRNPPMRLDVCGIRINGYYFGDPKLDKIFDEVANSR